MTFINRDFRDSWPSPVTVSTELEVPIPAGSWSEWAIRKVVVSRADNEWPNVLAWIIARFFVRAEDAALFFGDVAGGQGISEDMSRAFLGQPVENPAQVLRDMKRHIREIDAIVAGCKSAYRSLTARQADAFAAESAGPLPEDVDEGIENMRRDLDFSTEIEQRMGIVDRYRARTGDSLEEQRLADALCSTWLCGMNASLLERRLNEAGCDVEVSSDFGDEEAPSLAADDCTEWDSDSDSDVGSGDDEPLTAEEWAAIAGEWQHEATALPTLSMFPRRQVHAFR